MPATLTSPYHLTEEQKKFYHENGYLLGLPPIYTKAEMARINAELPNLLALLKPGETSKDIREWHEMSTYLYEIAMNPKILDLVEGILGANFYFWASNFFIKEPRNASTVGWHQDAYYWPMAPHNSVTVWLAFDEPSRACTTVTGCVITKRNLVFSPAFTARGSVMSFSP